MLPELVVTLRPNNQVSIALQNVCNGKRREIASSWDENLMIPPERLVKKKAHYKVRLANYRYRNPPLDIIQKFQHGLETSPEAALMVRKFWDSDRILAWWFHLKLKCCRRLACELFIYTCRMLVNRSTFWLNSPRVFGSVAAQRILESGAIIERMCGDRPDFAHCTTLTLPANYREAFECLAARANDCVNSLFQIIRRRYKDMKMWFFVWEFQRRGALHLHICHYHPDTAEGQWIGTQLIEQWHKILCQVSEDVGICLFTAKSKKSCTIRQNHQHHTQPMILGCGRYFAKYAMKASKAKENNYVRHHEKTLSPKRFWGRSRSLKEKVDESSICLRMYAMDGSPLRKFKEIEAMILAMEVIGYKQYEWKIEVVRPANPKNSSDRFFGVPCPCEIERLVVSAGFREVFYISSRDYYELINRYRGMCSSA